MPVHGRGGRCGGRSCFEAAGSAAACPAPARSPLAPSTSHAPFMIAHPRRSTPASCPSRTPRSSTPRTCSRRWVWRAGCRKAARQGPVRAGAGGGGWPRAVALGGQSAANGGQSSARARAEPPGRPPPLSVSLLPPCAQPPLQYVDANVIAGQLAMPKQVGWGGQQHGGVPPFAPSSAAPAAAARPRASGCRRSGGASGCSGHASRPAPLPIPPPSLPPTPLSLRPPTPRPRPR